MTNEESKELLQLDRKAYTIASPLELCLRTSQHVLFDNEEDKLREAIEVAIKALEQEPQFYPPCEDCNKKIDEIRRAYDKCKEQEPCGDAISRTAALNTLDTMDKALDENRTVEEYKELLRECFEQLPPVSTEKTGHWEWVPYDSNPNIGNWHCSECRNIIYQGVEKKGIHAEVIYKFCPWCGAKMEVEE